MKRMLPLILFAAAGVAAAVLRLCQRAFALVNMGNDTEIPDMRKPFLVQVEFPPKLQNKSQ